MRPPHDIVFKYTHRETARLIIANCTFASVGRLKKSLTPREQEIVRMVAKGYPNKTIAGVLNISCWTVDTHLRRTFAKLGVASRAAMVARIMLCSASRIGRLLYLNGRHSSRFTAEAAMPAQPS